MAQARSRVDLKYRISGTLRRLVRRSQPVRRRDGVGHLARQIGRGCAAAIGLERARAPEVLQLPRLVFAEDLIANLAEMDAEPIFGIRERRDAIVTVEGRTGARR